MSGGESSSQCGWCEQALPPGRLTEWSGPGRYRIPRTRSSGRLRARAASCEAICSESADRRRAACNSEMWYTYALTEEAHAASLYLERVGTSVHLKVAIFATVFSVSLMLCFGFGRYWRSFRDSQSRLVLIRVFPYYAVLTVYVIQLIYLFIYSFNNFTFLLGVGWEDQYRLHMRVCCTSNSLQEQK